MTRFRFPGLCNHWWIGEYPGDGLVEHECMLTPGHTTPHTCGCGSEANIENGRQE